MVPPVVAVLVAHDPGPWFEEALASLRDQTYSELSVLVLDAASAEDVTPRVAAVLPDAFVRRLDRNPGYGAAVNEILDKIKGAAFYLLCHDDVALDPDAVQVLVEEAFRSNAGVVGPKLVSWDDPGTLLQVGMAADRTGVPAPLAERGELDQEQHDSVRDVFAVPGGCMLVRTDLFEKIEGFDPGITFHGDDIDLCWRVRLAGARITVAPRARVRHREALGERRPRDDRRRLQHRHRVRTMLTSYRPMALLRVIPRAALHTALEVTFALLLGRFGQARELAGAWTWNLRRLRQLWRKRRQIHRLRAVSDGDIRRYQTKGSARFRAFVRGQIGREDQRLNAFRSSFTEVGAELRSPTRRIPILATAVVVGLVLVGSRQLLADGVPAVGEFARFPAEPRVLWDDWMSGWRTSGLGSEGPAPTAYGVLAVLGWSFLGSMDILREVLILGMIPIGAFGAWRMARPIGSVPAAVVSLVTYLAIPVPYNALASGSWSGLVLYAASPWVVLTLARATRLAPFGPLVDDPRGDGDEAGSPRTAGTPPRSLPRQVLTLGLVLAIAATLAPFVLAVAVVVAVAMAVGSVVAGRFRGMFRLLGTAIGGVSLAALLHLPWALDFVRPGTEWGAFAGRSDNGRRSADELLRFQSGPFGDAPYGWGFVVAAALPLLIGRRWRLEWATRAWFAALAAWALAWAGQMGWLPVDLPRPELLLAPAAAALALAIGLGARAFQVDVTSRRLGWRQAATGLAVVSVFAGALPLLSGVVDGRWDMPAGDLTASLNEFDRTESDRPSRVLWLGAPEALPVTGWQFDDQLSYATTQQISPDVRGLLTGSSRDSRYLADALQAATEGRSSRLGRLLGPMGIRYVLVPLARTADGGRRPPPVALTEVLAEQMDLQPVDVHPGVLVYENLAWMPMGVSVADSVPRRQVLDAARTDLSDVPPVLTGRPGPTRLTGTVDQPGTVLTAIAESEGWELRADGERAERGVAWGWANEFEVDGAGPAVLHYRTPPATRWLLGAQGALWLLALLLLSVTRRRATRRTARTT